jgi:hypothetical protein
MWIKIVDDEIYRKCKLLPRLNSLVVETLLELLFERVDVIDIQRAYIEGDIEGVRRLIRESFGGGDVRRVEVCEEGSSLDGKKKSGGKVERVEARSRLDADSFW